MQPKSARKARAVGDIATLRENRISSSRRPSMNGWPPAIDR